MLSFTRSVSYVPTGLSFGFSPCPRSSSWATVKPSLRDYRLVFPRVPGVPPGLRSNCPYGTIVWFFPVSQEFLLGYGQTVPTGLTCPSRDSMRGASSSVMHKFHRTKMSKLQGQAGQPVPHTRPNFCSCWGSAFNASIGFCNPFNRRNNIFRVVSACYKVREFGTLMWTAMKRHIETRGIQQIPLSRKACRVCSITMTMMSTSRRTRRGPLQSNIIVFRTIGCVCSAA